MRTLLTLLSIPLMLAASPVLVPLVIIGARVSRDWCGDAE